MSRYDVKLRNRLVNAFEFLQFQTEEEFKAFQIGFELGNNRYYTIEELRKNEQIITGQPFNKELDKKSSDIIGDNFSFQMIPDNEPT